MERIVNRRSQMDIRRSQVARNARKRVFALVLTICWLFPSFSSLAVYAQQVAVQNFTPDEYNSGAQNWGIGLMPNNVALFANNRGLLIFDSDAWRAFPVPNYSTVHAILMDDEQDRIYVGASDELGFFAIDEVTHIFAYHSLLQLLPEENRSFGEVWNIVNLGEVIVFVNKGSIMLYSTSNSTMQVVEAEDRIESSAVVNGDLIVGGKNGAYTLTHSELQSLRGTEALRGLLINSIAHIGSDILFATPNEGLFLYDGQQVVEWQTDISSWCKENQVFCTETKDNYLAVGSVRGGLLVKNLDTGDINYANVFSGLQNNTVLSLMIDQENNVWAGLDEGVSYVVLDMPYKSLLPSSNHIGTGYVSQLIGSHLFLGTNQGLFVIPLPIEQISIPPTPIKVNGIGGQIWCIQEVDDILLCGADDGLYQINGTTATRVEGPQGTWALCKLNTHPSCILAIDYAGLYVLHRDEVSYTFSHRVKGGDVEVSGSLIEDADGSVWLSNWQKGIYHLKLSDDLTRVESTQLFNKDNGLLVNENNVICQIDGKVYLSSVDGFRQLNSSTLQLEYAPNISKLFSQYGFALNVRRTPHHDLWAYKPGYIAFAKHTGGKYDVDEHTFNSMLSSLQMELGSYSFLDDERTLFNSHQGFIVAYNNQRFVSTGSHVFIRRIVSINATDSVFYTNNSTIVGDSQIVVPKKNNSLRFEFVLPEYRRPNAVNYECCLEPQSRHSQKHDTVWSQPQTDTYKEYTRLHKGRYVFKVRATNLLTGEVSQTSINVCVQPAWYETTFALIIYIIVFVLIVFYMVRWMSLRSKRELVRVQREKERQLKEQEARFTIEKEKRDKEILLLKNEQLSIDLKHKSSEIADSTINLIRKNDILQNIDDNMAELLSKVRRELEKDEVVKMIKEIRHNIKLHRNDDENWDKFEENFNLVYDDFMVKLQKQFPDLKKNERKLCVYLRMGLSSKEMASLMNTSVRSIDTARYRLRKKLELPSYANLKEFIQDIDHTKET